MQKRLTEISKSQLDTGMPKKVDEEQRKMMIAKNAAELISESGFSGASIREIAKKSGISRGLVEHYFRNKDEIIEYAISWMNSRYTSRMNDAAKGLKGIAALRARLISVVPINSTRKREWRMRLRFWTSTDARVSAAQAARLQRGLALFEMDLIDAIEIGEIPNTIDPGELSKRIMYITSGMCALAIANPDLFDNNFIIGEIDGCIESIKLQMPFPTHDR